MRLIAVNARLPEDSKIRLVSISDGLGRDNPHQADWTKAREALAKEGIEVVYSDLGVLSGLTWGGALPWSDRAEPSSYAIARFLADRGVEPGEVILPGDYRTTASNSGDDAYTWWGDGGYSWAIPYAAGLAALAWQIAPDLKLAQIEGALISTSVAAGDGSKVVQPKAFIERVRELK